MVEKANDDYIRDGRLFIRSAPREIVADYRQREIIELDRIEQEYSRK